MLEEQREQVLALLRAKAWEVIGASVSVTAFWQDRTLPIRFEGFQETEVWAFDQAQLRELLSRLPALNETAHAVIQAAVPEEDAGELALGDIVIYRDGQLALGYDAGPSAGGEVYLYVRFDSAFQPDAELIYEVY